MHRKIAIEINSCSRNRERESHIGWPARKWSLKHDYGGARRHASPIGPLRRRTRAKCVRVYPSKGRRRNSLDQSGISGHAYSLFLYCCYHLNFFCRFSFLFRSYALYFIHTGVLCIYFELTHFWFLISPVREVLVSDSTLVARKFFNDFRDFFASKFREVWFSANTPYFEDWTLKGAEFSEKQLWKMKIQ